MRVPYFAIVIADPMPAAAEPAVSAPPAVSPRHALLEQLIATAVSGAAEQMRVLATGLAGALVDGAALADGALQVRLRAGNLLRERHFAFLHLASDALQRELRHAIAQLAPAPAVLDLALVSYEEMEAQVTLGGVARVFDAAHADALAALTARLAIVLDRPLLRGQQNPFRPEVFIGALRQAWLQFQPEPEAAALLLPLLRAGRCYDFAPILETLNQALERAGVAASRPSRQAAHDGREAALAQQMRRLFAAAPTAAQGERGNASSAALLARLAGPARPGGATRLQGLKAQLPAGSLSRADETTIDLLDVVFETVAADGDVPADIRDLIHAVQLPVLKAALADHAFFFEADHPARRLLDLLSRMGWERGQAAGAAPHDALLAAMRRSVDTVAGAASSDDGAFAHAVAQLEAALREEEAATQAALAGPVATALRQERHAAAAQAARMAVAQRLAQAAGDDNAVVVAFLQTRWTDVLTLAHTVEERKPGAVRNATQAMDDLLWSVRPKQGADERRRLIASLPALLAVLNRWLDVIRWQDAERLRFFAELAECHAALVRAPLDLAPARQLALALDATRLAAARRQAASTPAPPADAAAQAVDALARGTWLEFAGTERARRVKLAWISPLRTLYIFSNGTRQEAFSLAADELAQRLRSGAAVVLPDEPLVARALGRAVDALAGNDADGGVRVA
ncbi:DUF1631 family protein [Pseudoduganella chitinolytica]|uniref:DUF1631 family protein n=1 Tax=Pseudoduganella chitinolytica TaxID=34070 RepID=A0ABY8BE83_9BURK|nr:DUF1631 family protein [Pseudoduganella chitinolytica]WEF34150.1 DUF1631 family protein [Pseudoduganella chitinolytica]